jgi:hypothetical protein
MKKFVTTLCAVAALALVAETAFAANAVRISQVYGGGGGASGTYIYDYVELFNSSNANVNIGGWAVEYGSATGSSFGSSSSNYVNIPANTVLPPCSYYFIQTGAAGSGGVAFPVTPDQVSSSLSMSASSGKVALVSQAGANLPCVGNTTGGVFVDVVAYGTGAGLCFETAAAPGTNATQSVVRGLGGMTDTDNNSSDFSLSNSPVPHKSGVANRNPSCLSTPTSSGTWGRLKSIYR